MNDSDSDSEDEEANSGNNLLNRIIEWYYKSNNKKNFLEELVQLSDKGRQYFMIQLLQNKERN